MTENRRQPSAADAKDALRTYWNDRAAGCSTDSERIESRARTQRMRFEMFLQSNDVEGRSVLDIGCGLGDFFGHLQTRARHCEYIGIDVSQEMVGRAVERFPGGRFETRDVLEWNPGRRFDYTVAFAIHNVRADGVAELMQATLRRQFELCTCGAHMSILTDRYGEFATHIQAWRAEDILSTALSITPYVLLQHHYLPHDFSVTLYREPLIDRRPELAE